MDMDKFKEHLKHALYDKDIQHELMNIFPDTSSDVHTRFDAYLNELRAESVRLRTELERLKNDVAAQGQSACQKQEASAAQLQEAQCESRQLKAQLQAAQQENIGLSRRVHELEQARDGLTRQLQEIMQKASVQSGQLREAAQKESGLVLQLQTANQCKDTLSDQNRHLSDENRTLRIQLEAAVRQGADQETRLGSERQRAEQMQEQLRQSEAASRPFQPLLTCYAKYCSLPDQVLHMLSPVLPADDPIRFWISGCQFNTLLLVWDAVKRQLEELSPEAVAVMTDILSFFISQYNSVWDSPIYELMLSETGAPFDQQRHIRSSDCSRYQGDVQKVVLPGIWNLNRKAAERRCVVWF